MVLIQDYRVMIFQLSEYFFTDPNDTLAPPSQDEAITMEMKLKVVRDSLARPDVTLALFDAKEQLKVRGRKRAPTGQKCVSKLRNAKVVHLTQFHIRATS